MNNKKILLASLLLGLVACGDNVDINRPDSRPRADAPPGTPDAPMIDAANVDAAVTTVTVTAVACPGTPDHTMTTAPGPVFVFDGDATMPNPDITIAAGENIEFVTIGQHNFESVLDTGAFSWESAPVAPGGHTACITFTAAGGPVDYQCDMHPTTMNGTITITP